MRVVIDFDQVASDELEGSLQFVGEQPNRFSGWLELLRLLEQASRTAGEGVRS
jgi:hypothetical protein